MKEFEQSYFRHYGGYNRPYRKTFKLYGNSPVEFRKFLRATGRRFPKSILDLGAADGSALKLFGRFFSADILHGVELSRYAFERRVVDDIFLGDMREFVVNRPAGFLRVYDLVLVNSAMYLRPNQLPSFLLSLVSLCHKDTTIMLALPSYYPSGMHTYLVDFKRACPGRGMPIIRPKAWWVEAAYDAGFEIISDLEGRELLLALPRKGFLRPPIFGNPENVALTFEFDRRGPSGKRPQISLRHLETGLRLTFTHRKTNSTARFVELGKPRSSVYSRALPKSLPDVLAFFRSGRVGEDHQVEFCRLSAPIYVPGTLCRPMATGFSLQSDSYF
jgi:hypothetical protein